jgi:hypothetical protein
MLTRLLSSGHSLRTDFQEGNDAYISYLERRFRGFYKGVLSTLYSEIRKHG